MGAGLPKGWKRRRLGDVCEINPRADSLKGVKAVSFVAMADVSESGNLTNQTLLPASKESVAGYTRFRRGDILCAKITPCFENGKGALVNSLETEQGIGSTEFHVIRTGSEVLPELVHAIAQSRQFRLRGELWMTGSAGQRRVPADYIKEFLIGLPPLSEQRRIVAVLDAYNRLVRGEQRRLLLLDLLRKGILARQIAVADKRTDKAPLSALADIRLSGVDKKSAAGELLVRLCNYTDVFYNEQIDASVEFMSATATQTEIDRFTLQEGDVLLTKDSETADEIAECAVVTTDLPGVLCGYHLTLLRPNEDRVLGGYLAVALRDPHVRHQFASCANGVTRFGLTLDAFDQIEIVLPSVAEQRRIVAVHAKLSGAIAISRKLIDRLNKQKRGLMQKLLTGEWRLTRDLPEWEAADVGA